MVFSSPIFLFGFLPLSLAVHFATPRKWRNIPLFLLSLIFYGWGEPVYIGVMLLSLTVAYLTAIPIDRYRMTHPRRARRWLILSLCLNLAPLLYFKYAGFFLDNLRMLPGMRGLPTLTDTVLPIGISFYTFQIMSYSIDLYRGDTNVQRSYIAFGTYVTLFPQLIAGPIVRYREINRQLEHRSTTVTSFAAGIRRFTVGLGKKVLLGDALAAAYAYLTSPVLPDATVLGAWMAVASFTLHIYFDFSGYSDMAIGLGRMLGFDFPENFNYPYTAASITDFWRRWHMTLSSWFREYVYIPLGGNRRGLPRQLLNMAAVWLLTGLWHGAAWNFVLWGGYFFLLLALEKAFLLCFWERNTLTRALGHGWTLLLVGIGWMIFDHPHLGEAVTLLGQAVGVGATGWWTPTVGYEILHLLPLLILGGWAATPVPARLCRTACVRMPRLAAAEPLVITAILILSVAGVVSGGYSPFLYFNF